MMVTSSEVQAAISPDYNREQEFRAFFDSKAGVKGVVASGAEKIPRIFVHNFTKLEDKPGPGNSKLSIPIIDIGGINQDASMHPEIINRIRDACEKWGFFQVVNHGIPVTVMDNMIEAVRMFHEQDADTKRLYCTNDPKTKLRYNNGTFDRSLLKKALTWGDCVSCAIDQLPSELQELVGEFRHPMMEYIRYVNTLGMTLLGFFSEALGLKTNHLKDIGCAEGLYFIGHYYPPCPEPELALGSISHTDVGFLNVLLQDQIGGLQVLHQNQWVDVTPLPGAFVVNLGDMLQLLTNDKFKSMNHRVLAKKLGPRISVASFMRPMSGEGVISRMYGPMEDLLSEENPPIYKKTTIKDYMAHHYSNLTSYDGNSPLQRFKI